VNMQAGGQQQHQLRRVIAHVDMDCFYVAVVPRLTHDNWRSPCLFIAAVSVMQSRLEECELRSELPATVLFSIAQAATLTR
jgi:hypothetical protein